MGWGQNEAACTATRLASTSSTTADYSQRDLMAWQEEEREPREGPAHRVVLGGLAAQLALGQELGAICTRAELHVSTRQRPASGWNGRCLLYTSPSPRD